MTRQHQSALSRLGFRDPDKENPRHGLACEYLQEKMRPYVCDVVTDLFQNAALQQINHNWKVGPDGVDGIHSSDLTCIPEALQVGAHFWSDPLNRLFLHEAVTSFIESSAPQWATEDINKCSELSSMVMGPSSGAKGFLDVSFRGKASAWHLTPHLIPGEFVYKGSYLNDGQELKFKSAVRMDKLFGSKGRPSFIYPFRNPTQFCCWGEVRIEPTAPELLLQQIEFYASNLPKSNMIWVLADFDLSDFKRMASQQFPQLKCFQLGQNFEQWCNNRERPEIPEL